MLSRMYSAPGGIEALDVLMKYMYVSIEFPLHQPPTVLNPNCFLPMSLESRVNSFTLVRYWLTIGPIQL